LPWFFKEQLEDSRNLGTQGAVKMKFITFTNMQIWGVQDSADCILEMVKDPQAPQKV
jgi:hypothetical protein